MLTWKWLVFIVFVIFAIDWPSVEFSIQSEPKKKSSSREIRITLLKKHEHNPEASLEPRNRAAGDTVPCSSSTNIHDEVEAACSLIQRVELDAKKLDYVSEVTSSVAGAADGAGEALNTAGNLVTFTGDFLGKCRFLSDRLGFIVGAVDKVAEVCSFPSIVSQFCSRW